MQLVCPNCGENIPSEHINIQRMAAVCPNCDTVFQFTIPESKIKRRKIRQPQRLTLHETEDHLQMAFRTNFRLDKDETFLSVAGLSAILTFVTVMLIVSGVHSGRGEILLMPVAMGLGIALLMYWFALIVYNKTYIEADDEEIVISRKPLPNILNQARHVNLSGIMAIRYEETPISKKEGYDTPRFRVWAETADSSRKTIVNDVIDDYALFITQRLNEYLRLDADDDESETTDVEQGIVHEQALVDLMRPSEMRES
jgi:hypothetical protein